MVKRTWIGWFVPADETDARRILREGLASTLPTEAHTVFEAERYFNAHTPEGCRLYTITCRI